MLVSFSVQNYRSFSSRQTFSMVAGTGAKKSERFSFATENSLAPHLLRSACLFGPNGAGKSALVKALDFYSDFVVYSAKDSQEGEPINEVTPFFFDKKWRWQPSEFEAVFIHGDALYRYGFAVDTERVWSEWLFSNPNTSGTRSRTLFQREYDAEREEYAWDISNTYVKGEKELWKKSTRDNALFLSTAIQLKAETFKEPFTWIQQYLRIIESPKRLSPFFTVQQCVEEDWNDKVLRLLQGVDIRIKDLNIDVRDFNPNDLQVDNMSVKEHRKVKKALDGKKILSIQSFHQGANGESVPLDFDDESDGSKVVFNLAGPWFDVLEKGYTLVVDELHNSLHPHALKFLVDLFHDPKINKNNAQLIFTSHETSVMAKDFMHRDQIWLLEKDDAESSKLIPLSDYKVRDVSAFQKAYLDGRYGAVPKIREYVDG